MAIALRRIQVFNVPALRLLLMAVMTLCAPPLFAITLPISPEGDIVGEIEYAHPQAGETLMEIGLRYDMGYYEMVHANPGIDPHETLSPGARIIIPAQFILPKAPHTGIIINLAEYRLYYFPVDDNVVMTFPVGIGHKGWSTPLGLTKIVGKQSNPTWHPTAKLIAQGSKNGVAIPDEFPPGPANPLGKHVLRLGWPTYLIHGTNRTDGIGERVSAGCIRMLPDDIEYLFDIVPTGTPVRVVNQPIKFGYMAKHLYMEAHPLLAEQGKQSLEKYTSAYISEQKIQGAINQAQLNQELRHPSGIPKKLT